METFLRRVCRGVSACLQALFLDRTAHQRPRPAEICSALELQPGAQVRPSRYNEGGLEEMRGFGKRSAREPKIDLQMFVCHDTHETRGPKQKMTTPK